MYVPGYTAVDDRPEAVAMVRAAGAGDLITPGRDGAPIATRLPVLWDGGGRVVAHMARANPHWRGLDDGTPALLIVNGPDGYVSPSWYGAKAEHGKVVPTWNYTAVHLSGTVVVRDEPDFVRRVVTDLTERHEGRRPDPWRVTDAPADFVDAMVRAIVGVELRVEKVDAKAKLSQNRSVDDQRRIAAGLRATAAGTALAEVMERGLGISPSPGPALETLGFAVRFCSGCGTPLPAAPPTTCAACGASHWRNPKPCANAIVVDGDRVLLARRAHRPWLGGWGSPGGFCEFGEHPADAAVREVREETGLDVAIAGYLGVWVDEYSDSPGEPGNEGISVSYYVARPTGGDIGGLTGADPSEVSEMAWFALDDLPQPLAPPATLAAVLAALRRWDGTPPLDR